MRKSVAAAIGTSALIWIGCGGASGSEGDPPTTPIGSELGDKARLVDLVGPATWLKPEDTTSQTCTPPADRFVQTSGQVITAIDEFDETGTGARGNFFVQDVDTGPAPYAGITVFRPSFSPPSLKLAAGDVVDFSGTLMEFSGPTTNKFAQCRTLPELAGTLSFRFDGFPPTIPVVQLATLKSYEEGRAWIGSLVAIESDGNAIVIADAPTCSDEVAEAACTANQSCTWSSSGEVCRTKSGRFAPTINMGAGVSPADVPAISNELFDLESMTPPLREGAKLRRVVGIITFFFSFKIAPRSAEDIVWAD